ncbi:hypothetical protein K0M31_012665, partial [Melipona bicolor]
HVSAKATRRSITLVLRNAELLRIPEKRHENSMNSRTLRNVRIRNILVLRYYRKFELQTQKFRPAGSRSIRKSATVHITYMQDGKGENVRERPQRDSVSEERRKKMEEDKVADV